MRIDRRNDVMSKDKKNKDAPTEKVVKTPEQLAEAHTLKLQRYVRNVNKWLKKTAKVVNSRKYKIEPEKREYIASEVDKMYAKFKSQMANETVESDEFTLV